MNELPWPERVNMLAVNPEAAKISDIKRLASELGEYLNHTKQHDPMEADNDEGIDCDFCDGIECHTFTCPNRNDFDPYEA